MATAQPGLSQQIDEYRKDYEQVQTELKEIDMLIQQTATEVDRLAQRNAQATNHLRQVESSLDTTPRADIQEAYKAVQQIQQRLFTMRGQLDKLQSDQKNLERYARLLRRVIEVGKREEAMRDEAQEEEAEADSTIVRLIEAQERERKRLARQMHDGPAQSLTNLVLQAEICERLFDINPERARVELGNLKTAVSTTFQRVKSFIGNLRPMMLDDLGLMPTLRRYVEDFRDGSEFSVNLNITGREKRIVNYKEATVFRVVQEILTNAREYSKASNVQLTVDMGDDRVYVAAEDNGSGFEMTELTGGSIGEEMGIETLRDRIEMLQGKFQIESTPGRGTRVIFEIPLP
ncbi:MAG: sensor histidine kinase [Anaerolineae bacterium]|nr:sensor histidine kinase [Anaerolineae bacterium]